MKKASYVLWGLVLMVAGVILALKVFGITNVDVFFDGWWTVFIIIPCTVGLFTEQKKIGNLMGIGLGVFMLLCCQDILSWKLLVPAILVVIGLKLVLTGLIAKKEEAPSCDPGKGEND